MIFPSTSQYLDSISFPQQHFKSKSFRRTQLCLDDSGEAMYSSSSNTTAFEVEISGHKKILRVFLNQLANDKYPLKEGAERYSDELCVVTFHGVNYYDIIIEEPPQRPKSKLAPPSLEVRENKMAYSINDKWGFKDILGNIIVEPKYESVELFYEGRAVVLLDGMYGLVDGDGVEVIPPIFDELSYDHSYYCTVERDGRFGVLDRHGVIVVALEWDWVGDFSQRRILVCRDGKYGYLDNHSRIITELIYDDATSFNDEGYAKVRVDSHNMLINTDGVRIG